MQVMSICTARRMVLTHTVRMHSPSHFGQRIPPSVCVLVGEISPMSPLLVAWVAVALARIASASGNQFPCSSWYYSLISDIVVILFLCPAILISSAHALRADAGSPT